MNPALIIKSQVTVPKEIRLFLGIGPGAEMIGWDVTALGLPAAVQPFERDRFRQHIEMYGICVERGRIDANDNRPLNSPLGLAGHRCQASIFFHSGSPLEHKHQQLALDCVRESMQARALSNTADATRPNDQIVVVRVLPPLVEPAMDLLRQIWVTLCRQLWQIKPRLPRIWAT